MFKGSTPNPEGSVGTWTPDGKVGQDQVTHQLPAHQPLLHTPHLRYPTLLNTDSASPADAEVAQLILK